MLLIAYLYSSSPTRAFLFLFLVSLRYAQQMRAPAGDAGGPDIGGCAGGAVGAGYAGAVDSRGGECNLGSN